MTKPVNMSRDIVISEIHVGAYRLRASLPDVTELIESIGAIGLLEPVGVVEEQRDRFTLVYGERRLTACKRLGWTTIPAILLSDPDSALLATLTENVARCDLNPVEEMKAFALLLDRGMTQQELAKAIGKDQSYISHKIRLVKLPWSVLCALQQGRITEGHARQLLRLEQIILELLDNHVPKDRQWLYEPMFETARSAAPMRSNGIVDMVTYYQDKMLWCRAGILMKNLTVRQVARRIDSTAESRDLAWLFRDDEDHVLRKCEAYMAKAINALKETGYDRDEIRAAVESCLH